MHLIDGGQRLEAAVQGEESEKRVPHTQITTNSSSTCLSGNRIHLS